MVVDAEVLRDRADADAAIVHRGNLRRDRLVDGRRDGLEKLSLDLNLGDGAKPLRTRRLTPDDFRLEADIPHVICVSNVRTFCRPPEELR